MNVEAKLKEILLQFLDVAESDITPSASLIDDFGADSFRMVDILIEIEHCFGVAIPEEQDETMTTVQATLDVIEAALARKKQPA